MPDNKELSNELREQIIAKEEATWREKTEAAASEIVYQD